MQILDLFCGMKSWSKPFECEENSIETLDIDPKFNPTYCEDILTWNPTKRYDLIFASPPCTYFSQLRNLLAQSEKRTTPSQLESSRKIAAKTFWIVDNYCKYYVVENPYWSKGMWSYFPERTDHNILDYCMYGYPHKKSTSLWSNIFIDFKRCNHKKGEHINLRRSKFPHNATARSIIPSDLVNEFKTLIIRIKAVKKV